MVSATTVAIQCEALKKIFIRGVFVVPPLGGITPKRIGYTPRNEF